MKIQIGLLFGVPSFDRPTMVDWGMAIVDLKPPPNYVTLRLMLKERTVDIARNEMARFAIEKECRYLYLQGDDVIPPPNTLQQLIYRMEQDPALGVVGGVYTTRSDPPSPLVFRDWGVGSFWKWKKGDFFEVIGIGMDLALIRVEIFSHMEYPWFRTIRSVGDPNLSQTHAELFSMTEDMFFCRKVKEETDFKIFADSAILGTHIEYEGKNRWRKYQLRPDSYPMLPVKGE